MDLQDLTDDERVALVGLVVLMIDADNNRSTAEMQEFREIAAEMGRRQFDAAFRAATARGLTKDDVGTLAGEVERDDARQLMHTILVDLAATDFVSEDERDIIRVVATAWGISSRI
jgi:uncharacterized tellurite resistance protein B-like protein